MGDCRVSSDDRENQLCFGSFSWLGSFGLGKSLDSLSRSFARGNARLWWRMKVYCLSEY